jgi:hypothetical protein
MKFEWHIEPSDIQAVKDIVARQQHRTFVINRMKRNVDGVLPEIDQSKIWQTQMMCLLTSRQRSGPNSAVSRILREKPFRLSLQACRAAQDVRSFVSSTLGDFRGIRFTGKIAKLAADNLRRLESGGWAELFTWLNKLSVQRLQPPNPSHYQLEREAARYMDGYKGFGPKQSRNFWQDLGLTRYELVLDARITRWLNGKIDIPVRLSSVALSDEAYYVFLSDILRKLCIEADVLPCVLDAAIFASYDEQEWPSEDW